MNWYNYLACFFSGAFLANAVPHFVCGISGNRFPTPFAKPPGKGLSSAPVNTVWGLLNMVAGYLLLRLGHIATDNIVSLIVFFAGIVALSVLCSINFQSKHAD